MYSLFKDLMIWKECVLYVSEFKYYSCVMLIKYFLNCSSPHTSYFYIHALTTLCKKYLFNLYVGFNSENPYVNKDLLLLMQPVESK